MQALRESARQARKNNRISRAAHTDLAIGLFDNLAKYSLPPRLFLRSRDRAAGQRLEVL
ncbi:MAG: hypothetical protein ACJAQ6_000087 [Arenicella sp.]|jgi:hypothetical protein